MSDESPKHGRSGRNGAGRQSASAAMQGVPRPISIASNSDPEDENAPRAPQARIKHNRRSAHAALEGRRSVRRLDESGSPLTSNRKSMPVTSGKRQSAAADISRSRATMGSESSSPRSRASMGPDSPRSRASMGPDTPRSRASMGAELGRQSSGAASKLRSSVKQVAAVGRLSQPAPAQDIPEISANANPQKVFRQNMLRRHVYSGAKLDLAAAAAATSAAETAETGAASETPKKKTIRDVIRAVVKSTRKVLFSEKLIGTFVVGSCEKQVRERIAERTREALRDQDWDRFAKDLEDIQDEAQALEIKYNGCIDFSHIKEDLRVACQMVSEQRQASAGAVEALKALGEKMNNLEDENVDPEAIWQTLLDGQDNIEEAHRKGRELWKLAVVLSCGLSVIKAKVGGEKATTETADEKEEKDLAEKEWDQLLDVDSGQTAEKLKDLPDEPVGRMKDMFTQNECEDETNVVDACTEELHKLGADSEDTSKYIHCIRAEAFKGAASVAVDKLVADVAQTSQHFQRLEERLEERFPSFRPFTADRRGSRKSSRQSSRNSTRGSQMMTSHNMPSLDFRRSSNAEDNDSDSGFSSISEPHSDIPDRKDLGDLILQKRRSSREVLQQHVEAELRRRNHGSLVRCGSAGSIQRSGSVGSIRCGSAESIRRSRTTVGSLKPEEKDLERLDEPDKVFGGESPPPVLIVSSTVGATEESLDEPPQLGQRRNSGGIAGSKPPNLPIRAPLERRSSSPAPLENLPAFSVKTLVREEKGSGTQNKRRMSIAGGTRAGIGHLGGQRQPGLLGLQQPGGGLGMQHMAESLLDSARSRRNSFAPWQSPEKVNPPGIIGVSRRLSSETNVVQGAKPPGIIGVSRRQSSEDNVVVDAVTKAGTRIARAHGTVAGNRTLLKKVDDDKPLARKLASERADDISMTRQVSDGQENLVVGFEATDAVTIPGEVCENSAARKASPSERSESKASLSRQESKGKIITGKTHHVYASQQSQASSGGSDAGASPAGFELTSQRARSFPAGAQHPRSSLQAIQRAQASIHIHDLASNVASSGRLKPGQFIHEENPLLAEVAKFQLPDTWIKQRMSNLQDKKRKASAKLPVLRTQSPSSTSPPQHEAGKTDGPASSIAAGRHVELDVQDTDAPKGPEIHDSNATDLPDSFSNVGAGALDDDDDSSAADDADSNFDSNAHSDAAGGGTQRQPACIDDYDIACDVDTYSGSDSNSEHHGNDRQWLLHGGLGVALAELREHIQNYLMFQGEAWQEMSDRLMQQSGGNSICVAILVAALKETGFRCNHGEFCALFQGLGVDCCPDKASLTGSEFSRLERFEQWIESSRRGPREAASLFRNHQAHRILMESITTHEQLIADVHLALERRGMFATRFDTACPSLAEALDRCFSAACGLEAQEFAQVILSKHGLHILVNVITSELEDSIVSQKHRALAVTILSMALEKHGGSDFAGYGSARAAPTRRSACANWFASARARSEVLQMGLEQLTQKGMEKGDDGDALLPHQLPAGLVSLPRLRVPTPPDDFGEQQPSELDLLLADEVWQPLLRCMDPDDDAPHPLVPFGGPLFGQVLAFLRQAHLPLLVVGPVGAHLARPVSAALRKLQFSSHPSARESLRAFFTGQGDTSSTLQKVLEALDELAGCVSAPAVHKLAAAFGGRHVLRQQMAQLSATADPTLVERGRRVLHELCDERKKLTRRWIKPTRKFNDLKLTGITNIVQRTAAILLDDEDDDDNEILEHPLLSKVPPLTAPTAPRTATLRPSPRLQLQGKYSFADGQLISWLDARVERVRLPIGYRCGTRGASRGTTRGTSRGTLRSGTRGASRGTLGFSRNSSRRLAPCDKLPPVQQLHHLPIVPG